MSRALRKERRNFQGEAGPVYPVVGRGKSLVEAPDEQVSPGPPAQ